jgi:hypothetical protein
MAGKPGSNSPKEKTAKGLDKPAKCGILKR